MDIPSQARTASDFQHYLVERYFGAFLDEVLRHGGDVNEIAGDGLMVIFQHADAQHHARAAARAALGILQRAQEINDDLKSLTQPITLHIGVNSGTAAVGATKIEGTAGTRWTYTASGSVTNVAARLAALETADGICLGAETCRRPGPDFELEDLGDHRLKNVGRADPRLPPARHLARILHERRCAKPAGWRRPGGAHAEPGDPTPGGGGSACAPPGRRQAPAASRLVPFMNSPG